MTEPLPRPYGGIRIIDLTRELGSYTGRLFADLGAEVIRVDEPARGEAAPGQDYAHAFFNANKKSVVIDTGAPGGREALRDLLASAAIVLFEPPHTSLDIADILAIAGPKVVTAVSYFGLTGPYAGFKGSDLIAQSLGGITWLSGEPGKPPLRIAGEQSRFVGALYAAAATAIALWDAENRGGRHVLDVSTQEAIAHSLQNAIQVYDLEKRISVRGGEGTRDATESVFACRDGYVSLAAPLALPASWNGLLQWMRDDGFKEVATLEGEEWKDRARRATSPMRSAFKDLFERFIADKERRQIGAEALKRKIVMAPVSRLSDLPADPQLVFRRYFQKVHERAFGKEMLFPGAPYRLSEPVWSLERSAPPRGGDADALPISRRA